MGVDEVSTLTDASFGCALAALCAGDPRLAGIVNRFGAPPLRPREPGFPTLLHIILEQQVSLASAQAELQAVAARCYAADPQRALMMCADRSSRNPGFAGRDSRPSQQSQW